MLFKFSTLASLDKKSAKGYYVHMHRTKEIKGIKEIKEGKIR